MGQEYVFGAVLLLANKLQVWGEGLVDELTMKQWFLLVFISRMTTPRPSVTQVAEFTGTSRQNTKKMLALLDAQGFVDLAPSTSDGRALSVGLTDKTWACFADNQARAVQAAAALFEGVTDEDLAGAVHTLEHLLAVLGNPPLDQAGLR